MTSSAAREAAATPQESNIRDLESRYDCLETRCDDLGQKAYDLEQRTLARSPLSAGAPLVVQQEAFKIGQVPKYSLSNDASGLLRYSQGLTQYASSRGLCSIDDIPSIQLRSTLEGNATRLFDSLAADARRTGQVLTTSQLLNAFKGEIVVQVSDARARFSMSRSWRTPRGDFRDLESLFFN